MGRGTRRPMGSTEARERLPKLVSEAGSVKRPSRSPDDRAVRIRPRGKPGAVLVPEVDWEATLDRLEELEDRLEDVGIGLFLQERLIKSPGKTIAAEDFLRDLGFEEKVGRLPGR